MQYHRQLNSYFEDDGYDYDYHEDFHDGYEDSNSEVDYIFNRNWYSLSLDFALRRNYDITLDAKYNEASIVLRCSILRRHLWYKDDQQKTPVKQGSSAIFIYELTGWCSFWGSLATQNRLGYRPWSHALHFICTRFAPVLLMLLAICTLT